MFRERLYDFSGIKKDAGKYRVNLQELKKSLETDVEAFIYSKTGRPENINFYRWKRGALSSAEINANINNIRYVLYNHFLENEVITNTLFSLKLEENNYGKVLSKNLLKIEDSIEETIKKLNSKYTKVKYVSIFKEKDFEETYDLIDIKSNLILEKKYQCDFKEGSIECKKKVIDVIEPIKAEIIKENSFIGDDLIQINISEDTSYIWRENKVYSFIVGKKINHVNQSKIKHRPVELKIIFSLKTSKEINELDIRFGSSLPCEIKTLEYLKNNEWVEIENKGKRDFFNGKKIFFDKIRTNKIKLVIKQSKFYSNELFEKRNKLEKLIEAESNYIKYADSYKESVDIFDLSISSLKLQYKKSEKLGFYREAEETFIESPVSIKLENDFYYEDKDCFVEKELHLVIYGDKSTKAFKNKEINSLRVNKIVKIPNDAFREKEVLIFNSINEARCSYFPKIRKEDRNKSINEIIKVFKEEVELIPYVDYLFSLDGGENFFEEETSLTEIEASIKNRVAGNFIILLKNRTVENRKYTIEYQLDGDFYIDEKSGIKIKNKEIVFPESYESSSGFVRPRFILRNQNKNLESSIIKRYKLLIEEKEKSESSKIDYETFKEKVAGDNNNVI